jgi:hypothetical protein
MTETAGIILVTVFFFIPLAIWYDEAEEAFGKLLDWFSKK